MKDIWTAPSGVDNAGWKVTPADLKQAREDAIARGADRSSLEQQYAALVRQYGSEERLCEVWTMRRWQEAYDEQLHPRDAGQEPPPAPPAPSKSPDDRKRLIALINQYPELAAEVLKDLPRPDQ
ncbi:hypothetical protein AB0K05_25025 [Nonomuraea sp. NPDC049486]|uniref:hypothetical protein n=1 Tax=Nonomuraea sp. NPDC049486 TaxID=3155773 RepID=UPI0034259AF9